LDGMKDATPLIIQGVSCNYTLLYYGCLWDRNYYCPLLGSVWVNNLIKHSFSKELLHA
jgi:hypothetical protein